MDRKTAVFRPATAVICVTDDLRGVLESCSFPRWMQTLGLHLTSSLNNHPCPKLRWVFGIDYMALGKMKSHFPRFTAGRPILGIPFLDYPRKGKNPQVFTREDLARYESVYYRHSWHHVLTGEDCESRADLEIRKRTSHIDFDYSFPPRGGWSFERGEFTAER